MAILATTSSTQRELIPAGTYVARCYQMIEIGTVSEQFPGQEPKPTRKVRIGWELPTERRIFNEEKGEQPFVISKEFTLSTHEKSNLRKSLESWRGKGFSDEEAQGFDVTKLLGKSCMLNVIHRQSKDGQKQYAEIAGIMPVPKGLVIPPQENKTIYLSYDNFDYSIFENLPDFIKDKMKGSLEYASLQQPNHFNADNTQTLTNEADDLLF